jgi:hypothetical protein
MFFPWAQKTLFLQPADDLRSGRWRANAPGFLQAFPQNLDTAFASLVQKRIDALLVMPDALFEDRRVQLAALTARHAVPAIFANRENVAAGGLMSYGSSFTDLFRQAGIYTGRILKGQKPANLPILRPTKFAATQGALMRFVVPTTP